MSRAILQWAPNEALSVGKGATVQEFFAELGECKLEIKVAPWGEGDLIANGRNISHIDNAKDRRQAFRRLAQIAEQYVKSLP